MSSIIRNGDTFHGISVFGRSVFSNDERDVTYAGQCKDGYACRLGVATYSNGSKVYAEHGPDGKFDGRLLDRWASGTASGTWYRLYERGTVKGYAAVSADGDCEYDFKACSRDDPRLLALIAQVAPVEVRPAAPAPHPPSSATQTPSNRPMDQPARFAPAGAREGHGNRGASPRRTPYLVAVRHKPTAGAMHSTTMPWRAHVPVRRRGRMGGTLVHPGNRRQVHNQAGRGGFVAMPCPARHRADSCHARAGCTLHVSVHTSHERCDLPLRSHPVLRACRPVPILFTWGFSMRS